MTPTLPPSAEDFRIPPAMQALLETEASTEALVSGKPGGEPRIGMVLKRTYKVAPDGRCELAPDGDQELVVEGRLLYEDLEPPQVSPIAYDDDTAAFRSATDVVVQGDAQTYGQVVDRTTVALTIGDWRREIRVFGDRRAEWKDGALRFTAPEPFERMPVRYDRAYGGYDARALRRIPDPLTEQMKRTHPELTIGGLTAFHYARNPAGRGFLMLADEASAAEVEVPNLEFPFDPVTPERLAIGHPDAWLQAPLPACMDWTNLTWFPRVAYLGLPGLPEDRRDEPVREVELGWAPPDLLQIPSRLKDPLSARTELGQASSPGMAFAEFDPACELRLEGFHPEQSSWRVRLPGDVPYVQLGLGGPSLTALEPHLNAVVVRPDLDDVTLTWCASTPIAGSFNTERAPELRREIDWRRGV